MAKLLKSIHPNEKQKQKSFSSSFLWNAWVRFVMLHALGNE